MTDLHDNASSYNALLSVAEANRALALKGEEQVVGELLEIIASAGFADQLGIRLLHKHNDLHAGDAMAETSLEDEEGYALVTRITSTPDLTACHPNSWQLTGSGFVPVEYSDVALLASTCEVQKYGEVFERLAGAIRRHNVVDLLGPAVNYSSSVMARASMLDAALLEKTDEENVANIVRFVDRSDVAFTNSAKTKWHAKRMITDDGRVVWMTACNCFCSVSENGGHLGTKTHRYNSDATSDAETNQPLAA